MQCALPRTCDLWAVFGSCGLWSDSHLIPAIRRPNPIRRMREVQIVSEANITMYSPEPAFSIPNIANHLSPASNSAHGTTSLINVHLNPLGNHLNSLEDRRKAAKGGE